MDRDTNTHPPLHARTLVSASAGPAVALGHDGPMLLQHRTVFSAGAGMRTFDCQDLTPQDSLVFSTSTGPSTLERYDGGVTLNSPMVFSDDTGMRTLNSQQAMLGGPPLFSIAAQRPTLDRHGDAILQSSSHYPRPRPLSFQRTYAHADEENRHVVPSMPFTLPAGTPSTRCPLLVRSEYPQPSYLDANTDCPAMEPRTLFPVAAGGSSFMDPFTASRAVAPPPPPELPVLHGARWPWSFAAWVSGNSERLQPPAAHPIALTTNAPNQQVASTTIPLEGHVTTHSFPHEGRLLFPASDAQETRQNFEEAFGDLLNE